MKLFSFSFLLWFQQDLPVDVMLLSIRSIQYLLHVCLAVTCTSFFSSINWCFFFAFFLLLFFWGVVVKVIDWYFILCTVYFSFGVLRVLHAGKTRSSEAFSSLQDSCFCASAAVHFVITNLSIPCCPAFIAYYCLILCLPKVIYCWCSLLPDIASSC